MDELERELLKIEALADLYTVVIQEACGKIRELAKGDKNR
jgi:hypothetical protein